MQLLSNHSNMDKIYLYFEMTPRIFHAIKIKAISNGLVHDCNILCALRVGIVEPCTIPSIQADALSSGLLAHVIVAQKL